MAKLTNSDISKYEKIIYSIANRMISNRVYLEDACQDAWLNILKNIDSFQEKSLLSTWIYSTALKSIINYSKKEQVYSTKFLSNYFHGDEIKPNEITFDENFDKKIWTKQMCDSCITGILHCLDDYSRAVYILKGMCGLSHKEIAKILDKKTDNVRQIYKRSKQKLHVFLDEECGIYSNKPPKCRMKKYIEETKLSDEFINIKNSVNKIRFLKATEVVFDRDDISLVIS